jgi:hypothetical protein
LRCELNAKEVGHGKNLRQAVFPGKAIAHDSFLDAAAMFPVSISAQAAKCRSNGVPRCSEENRSGVEFLLGSCDQTKVFGI